MAIAEYILGAYLNQTERKTSELLVGNISVKPFNNAWLSLYSVKIIVCRPLTQNFIKIYNKWGK